MKHFIKIYLILFFLLLFNKEALHAQSPSLIEFGQNRVQYKTFKWQFYETENFNVYFYKGGQDLGKYTILNVENLFEEMTKKLDFRLDRKIDLLVYNDISDLRQSNIGLETKEQIENGQVKFVDNKLFIYFNGSHKNLDEQIRQGINQIFINKFVSGSGLKETFKNSVARNLPQWYLNGLTAYNSKGWNTTLENELKDKILSGRFKDLTKLNEDEMTLVGHSIWVYVEEKYGLEAAANLMYLVKINRSLDRGFRYVTEKTLGEFLEEWYYSYLDRFKIERKEFNAIDKDDFVNIKTKKSRKIYNAKLNPDGKSIAYITNEEGKWRIHLYNLKDSTKKIIFKGGFKTNTVRTDLMNPMIDWEQRGKKLTIIYELRDKFFIRDYIVETKKLEDEAPIRKFQKIYGFSYAENSKNLILSAMRKGQIDIFKYYVPSTKVTQITNDFYDDLQPSYIKLENYSGYAFISNRNNDSLQKQKLDNILPNNNFDVFFYNLNENNQRLVQITKTPNANESFPQAYDKESFTFLSDYNGINNRYLARLETKKAYDRVQYFYKTNENPNEIDSIVLDKGIVLDSAIAIETSVKEIVSKNDFPVYRTSGTSFAVTKYNNSIRELSTSTKVNKSLKLILFKNKERFVITEFNKNTVAKKLKNSGFVNYQEAKERLKEAYDDLAEKESAITEDTVKKEIVFQSKFDDWQRAENEDGYASLLTPMSSTREEEGGEYKFSRTRQYFLKFKADNFNFSLDNKLVLNSYQKFNPNSPIYNNQGLGGFIKLGVKDLFENHRIHGGLRIPLDGSNIVPKEFYLTYENLTKRLDYELTYYRNSISNSISEFNAIELTDEGEEVIQTNYVHLKFKYPLDILNSVRLKLAYRNDNTVTKSTEQATLNASNLVDNWAIVKLEFVHDHTIKKTENILNGFRANGYVEFQKEIPTKDTKIGTENLKLPTWNDGYVIAFGADVSHYQKVFKTITWANRVAFSSSLGTRKVLFYLGGSDGQLFPGYDKNNEVNPEKNYAFQSLAQNMRGVPQNTRHGESYFVINSELRVPLFSAFSKKQMRSKFIESLQLIAFIDGGSAWTGVSPWSGNNIQTETRTNFEEKPESATIIVKLNTYKDPFIFAFGPGLRANIFDYFFRFDLGWAYDTGVINAPKMHVSMTYDF
jgi:hypothetical protein